MSKRKRSPKSKGVARVPVIMQMEATECGPAALAMVLAYYGKWIPLSNLRDACGVSRDGIRMSTIAVTARKYGLEAQGYRYQSDEFFRKTTFPCVVHWNFTHFVVVCGSRGNKVYINDPANGYLKITKEEFDESFTGLCIGFRPGEGFEASGRQRSITSYLKNNLKGARKTVVFVALATFIISLISLLLPATSRMYIDRILGSDNVRWLMPIVVVLSCICLIQLIVGWIQAVYQMKLFGILGMKASVRYMWHIFHMPARFYFQRMPGYLQQNEEASRTIAETFIMRFVPIIVNSLMMIFYLAAMLRYSIFLSAVGLSVVILNLILTRYIANRRINIVRVMKTDLAKLMSSSMAGVGMVETIKASGAENAYFGRWSGYQANVNKQDVHFEKTTQILGSLPEILVRLTSVLLLCGGVYLVTTGHFSEGMVVSFQAYLTAFMDPALQMINSNQMIQEMRTDMERVEDVMNYPEYDLLGEDHPDKEYERISGNIELKNITFGYSSQEAPLITDFSMSIRAGDSIAVVGSSGCGKSTILSLISGLYEPWEGTILYDGKTLSEISQSAFRGSISVINQEIILFKDTIANNIKMWDGSIDDYEMILAAKDAQIHDEIMKRENRYNHVLLEGGVDFSGGQRQRIEIARALVNDPAVIIMDEATNALDADTESSVVKSIHDRGTTCIIVAHRLSTVRNCDKIIVLDQGHIVEQGTHDELMALQGYYYSLVQNN